MRVTEKANEVPVNLVGSSVFGRYPKISAEKTYNMFISGEDVVNFAGYERVAEMLASGEGRGIYKSSRRNIMIAVVNSNVYRIDSNLAPVLIGNIETQSGEVYMDENLANQICIVDGQNAYIYNTQEAPNLTKQTLSPDLVPNYVRFHSTFFLFGNASKGLPGDRWFVYQPATATTISETSFHTVSTKPDYALAVERVPGQSSNVMVFGATVCEIHTKVDGLENYALNRSVSIDYGCSSVSTIATSDKHIIWLGVNEKNAPVIMMFTGQSAEQISSDGIDYLMRSLVAPQDSTASFVRQDGHLLYVITFFHPDDNLTLMFDVNTGKFFHLSDGDLNFHPARQFAYFQNKTFFVSINNGSLYELSTDFTRINHNIDMPGWDDDPRLIEDIPRIRICKTVRADNTAPFRANSFTFLMDMGNDLPKGDECTILMITEDGVRIITEDDAQVIPEDASQDVCHSTPYRGRVDLAISGNGGETYSNYVPRWTNPRGDRRNIMQWENMGMYNEWTAKVRFWTSGRVIVGNGTLETF
ncbi:MAG: hypothetical protein DRQ48_00805 [Gammaproteobacteria bacterium]|nr:MAG: hypothetical protein DRQ44_00565 [Gammaproteobacteria bacterium]RKZ72218.1 MAG: hypothetical protein DRQ48_00805 [Gammaproteobacteria bacterium]